MIDKSSRLRNNWLPLTLLAILCLVFFWPVLLGQYTFFSRDVLNTNYVYQLFDYQAYRSGQLPLWNPYIYGGFPTWAEGQSGPLYPGHLLSNLFFPFTYSFNFQFVLHYFWAGLGMYFWVKLLGRHRSGALLAAVSFAFSGTLVSRLIHMNILIALSWVPWLFYLTERLFLKQSWLAACGLTLALFCQLSAGQYQLQIYTWFFLCLYVLWRCFTLPEFSRYLGFKLFWVGGTFLGLSAVLVLPGLELIKFSVRSGTISSEFLMRDSFPPWYFLNYLLPYAWGNPTNNSYLGSINFWEACPYIGVIPLLLVLFARRGKTSAAIKFIFFLGLGATLLSLGKHVPFLANAFMALPVLGKMRVPARYVFFATFAACSLAGLAFNQIFEAGKAKKQLLLLLSLLGLGFTCLALIATYAGIDWKKLFTYFASILKVPDNQPLLDRYLTALTQTLWRQAAICYTGALVFWLLLRDKVSLNLGKGLLLGVVIADLFSFGLQLNPVINTAALTEPPALLSHIDPESGGRLYSYQVYGYENYLRRRTRLDEPAIFNSLKNLLPPATSILWQRSSLAGSSSLFLASVADYYNYLETKGPLLARNLLQMADLEYMLSPVLWDGWEEKLIAQAGDIYLYRLPATERAYLTSNVVETGPPNLGALLALPPTLVDKTVLVEKNPWRDLQRTTLAPGVATFTQYNLNEVRLRVTSATDTVLVLKDVYYPGWEAYVNGQRTEIYQANYLFRALKVPRGDNEVVFVYRPRLILIGGLISLGSFLIVLITVAISLRW